MIGDTDHDVAAARAANVPVIHIHRGNDPLQSNPSDRIYVARGFGSVRVRN